MDINCHSSTETPAVPRARLATLDAMRQPGGLLSQYLDPVPSKRALTRWFNLHRIPRVKANIAAKRGGGIPYYRSDAVERLLRKQMGEASGG